VSSFIPSGRCPAAPSGENGTVTKGGLTPVLSLGALVALVVGVAAGCGGGGGGTSVSTPATPQEWAGSVCTAFKTWESSLQSLATQFQSGQLSKDGLQSAATQVEDATQKLSDDLKSIGKPPTPNADKAKSTLDDLSSEFSNSVDQIKSATKNLSSASDVASAVSATAGTISQLSASISASMKTLESLDAKGTYTKAFQQAPACKGLQIP
jgi:hypothetical protein